MHPASRLQKAKYAAKRCTNLNGLKQAGRRWIKYLIKPYPSIQLCFTDFLTQKRAAKFLYLAARSSKRIRHVLLPRESLQDLHEAFMHGLLALFASEILHSEDAAQYDNADDIGQDGRIDEAETTR